MKKIIILLILAISLAGCGAKGAEKIKPGSIGKQSNINITDNNVTLEINEKTLTNSEAEYTLNNSGIQMVFIVNNLIIEKKENGVWYELKLLHEIMYAVFPFSLEANDSITRNLNWEHWYGKLPEGQYRLILKLSYDKDYSKPFYVSAEFNL